MQRECKKRYHVTVLSPCKRSTTNRFVHRKSIARARIACIGRVSPLFLHFRMKRGNSQVMIFRVPQISIILPFLIVFHIYSCLVVINEGNARNCSHRFPAIWSDRKELEANLSLLGRKSRARNKFRLSFFADFIIHTFYYQVDVIRISVPSCLRNTLGVWFLVSPENARKRKTWPCVNAAPIEKIRRILFQAKSSQTRSAFPRHDETKIRTTSIWAVNQTIKFDYT